MLQTINVIDRVILILKYINVINGINLSDKPEGENCKGGGRKGFVEASVPLNTVIIIIIINYHHHQLSSSPSAPVTIDLV